MDPSLFQRLDPAGAAVSYAAKRAIDLFFMNPVTGPAGPRQPRITQTEILRAELELLSQVELNDPEYSPLDYRSLREAKQLYRMVLNEIQTDCESPDPRLLRLAAERLSEAADSEEDEVLSWLLASTVRFGLWTRELELKPVFAGLARVPERPGTRGLLIVALSAAAHWHMTYGGGAREADPFFERAFRLAGDGPFRQASLLFIALSFRAAAPEPVRYGPGAGLGRAAPIRNALRVAPCLKFPSVASLLPHVFLRDRNHLGLTLADLERAAGDEGLPENPDLRACWAALEASVASRRGGPGASAAVMGALRRLDSEGLLPVLGQENYFRGKLLENAATSLGEALASLPRPEAREALRILAPRRADGSLTVRPYGWLTLKISLREPALYREAVMEAVAEGLFGDGPACLHAVATALCLYGDESGGLSPAYGNRVAAFFAKSWSPKASGPLAARLAARLAQADLLLRGGRSPHRALHSLMKLWPGSAGPRRPNVAGGACPSGGEGEAEAEAFPAGEGQEPAGSGLGRPSRAVSGPGERETEVPAHGPTESAGGAREDAGDAVELCLYAYSIALLLCRRARPGSPSFPGRFLRALPKEVLENRLFTQVFLPTAAYAELRLNLQAPSKGALLSAVLTPGSPVAITSEIWGLVAFRIAWELSAAPPKDAESLRDVMVHAEFCLSEALPPGLRALLVGAGACAWGHLGLCDEMEAFYAKNALMQVEIAAEDDEWSDPDDHDLIGLSGARCRPVSTRLGNGDASIEEACGFKLFDAQGNLAYPPKSGPGARDRAGAGGLEEDDLDEDGSEEDGLAEDGSEEDGLADDGSEDDAGGLDDGGDGAEYDAGALDGGAEGEAGGERGAAVLKGGSDLPRPASAGAAPARKAGAGGGEARQAEGSVAVKAASPISRLIAQAILGPAAGVRRSFGGVSAEEGPGALETGLAEDVAAASGEGLAGPAPGDAAYGRRAKRVSPADEVRAPGPSGSGGKVPSGGADDDVDYGDDDIDDDDDIDSDDDIDDIDDDDDIDDSDDDDDIDSEDDIDDGGDRNPDTVLRPMSVAALNPLSWTALAVYNAYWNRHQHALEYFFMDKAMRYYLPLKVTALERLIVRLIRDGLRQEASFALDILKMYSLHAADPALKGRVQRLIKAAMKGGAKKPKPKKTKQQKKGAKGRGPKKGGPKGKGGGGKRR
ncbi:MAG: hypothetical protein LBW85_02320 [Deltaproteobacteria bacterium]|jgi:hypothetical protein|nr:hypothetical protein [Deltaproteobacteria bacterium]